MHFSYYQKSQHFIYPLLKLKGRAFAQPISTYFQLQGPTGTILETNYKTLFALYHADALYKKSEARLLDDAAYETSYQQPLSDFVLIAFDCSAFAEDFDKVMEGKYSELSNGTKSILLYNEPRQDLIWALNPQDHYYDAARELSTDVELLVGNELARMPKMDTDGEIYTVDRETFDHFHKHFNP